LEAGFPKERGYGIYHGEKADALVIRLGDLNHCAPEAFYEFTGIKNFHLENQQVSGEKYYSKVYRQFINQAEFPESFLNRIYDLRFAKTFYTQAEIYRFRAKWGKSV